jgi:hypothetical protein
MGLNYDLFALLGGKLHVPLVVFDLKQVMLIKDKDGVLCVDKLKIIEESKKKAEEKEKPAEETKAAKAMPMQLDLIRLNIGEVVLKDYSKGEPPLIKAYDAPLKDKEFKNVTNVPQLVTLVLFQAVSAAGLKSAAMYAATTVLGVGFIPAGIAGVILADDDGIKQFNASQSKVFQTALKTVQEMGSVVSQDEGQGLIKAEVQGNNVTIHVTKKDNGTAVEVSARNKFKLAKPEIAQGVLYEMEQKLK